MEDNKVKNTSAEAQGSIYKPFAPLRNKSTPAPVRKPAPAEVKVEAAKPAAPASIPQAPKTKAQIKEEVKDVLSTFGSAGVDDINRNVGKFTSTVVDAEEDNEPSKEIKLDADAKVVEKAANEKINFERFKKTKRDEKAAKTKFGERVSLMLRDKKKLTITWVLEMTIMALMMAVGITLVACLTKYNQSGSPFLDPVFGLAANKVGVVFAWIGIFPCLVPLIYLLIAWFVGINQVASSRMYHFIFWGALALSVLCIIIALGCCGPMMDNILHWGGDLPK